MTFRTGIAETAVGKLYGRTSQSLAVEAGLAAIADAGLELADIDGIVTAAPLVGGAPRHALTLAETLGICEQVTYCDTLSLGGASMLTGFVRACRLVESGQLRAVLVLAADTQRTGRARGDSVAAIAAMRHPLWEQPFGMANVSAYALLAQRYLDRYGLDKDALAVLPAELRRHAATQPGAVYTAPLDAAEVTASRMIASPLHLLECSPISDGGAAVVVHSIGGGAGPELSMPGAAEGYRYDNVSFAGRLEATGASLSGGRAFAAAGLAPADVDVALLYDSYSITLAVELEELGLCEPGGAPALAAAGGLRVDGAIPTNTHGGLLSHSHCGAAAGMNHLVEAIRQLRGAAANQVDGARTALLHAEGGILSANCTALLQSA
jgi:acetyl-CoA acetyltransferase